MTEKAKIDEWLRRILIIQLNCNKREQLCNYCHLIIGQGIQIFQIQHNIKNDIA